LNFDGAYNVSGGPLAVNAGTLTFGSTSTVLSTPAVTLNNSGTVINFNGTAGASIGALTLNASTTANLGQNVSATGLSGVGSLNLANGNLTLTPGTAQTFNGAIGGNGSLLFSPTSPALLTLGGNNSAFAGGITGNGNARLAFTSENAPGTGAIDLSAQNASSDFAVPTIGFNFGNGSFTTVSNNIVLSQVTGGLNLFMTSFGSTNQTIELSGLITSSGGSTNTLVWDTAGISDQSNILILSNNANSFVANVRVGSGTIAIASNGVLGPNSNQLTLANGSLPAEGSLRFDADGINLNRQVNVVSNGASINTNGNNATITGLLTGTSTLSKLGTGRLTLGNAANTFNGIANVNNGTLLVNGSLPGATGGVNVNVNNGGTLAGTGTVGTVGALRSVVVSGGGTLAGGDPEANIGIDPGTLTVRGNITVNAGGNFQVRLTTALVSNGTNGSSSGGGADPTNNSYLMMTETGTVFTLNGNIVIDGTGLTFSPNQPYSYLVAQLPTGAPAVNITDPSRFQTVGFVDTPENMALITDSGFVYLNFSPVPEPGTVLGLAAGALGLGGYVRRRLRRA
jgi:autotransporter-associated beta strand protein